MIFNHIAMSHTFWNAQSVTADEQCCASLLTIGDLSFNDCVRNSREILKKCTYMPKNQMIFPEFWVFYQNITVNPRSYYITIEYCEMFMVVHFY